jgi:hypothetical protein
MVNPEEMIGVVDPRHPCGDESTGEEVDEYATLGETMSGMQSLGSMMKKKLEGRTKIGNGVWMMQRGHQWKEEPRKT